MYTKFSLACLNPERFVRGGPTSIMFFIVDKGGGGSKYHYKWAIVGPPAKRLVLVQSVCEKLLAGDTSRYM